MPSAGLVYLEWVRDGISICRHVGIVVKVCVRWRERVGEGVKRGSKQYSEKYVERVCVFVQEGRVRVRSQSNRRTRVCTYKYVWREREGECV